MANYLCSLAKDKIRLCEEKPHQKWILSVKAVSVLTGMTST